MFFEMLSFEDLSLEIIGTNVANISKIIYNDAL